MKNATKLLTKVAFFLLVFVFFVSCNSQKKVTVDAKNAVEITVGDTVKIELTENASTGYTWKWKHIEGKNRLVFLKDEVRSNVPDSLLKKGFVGGSATHYFYFFAKKQGYAVLEFNLSRGNQKPAKKQQYAYVIKKK